MNQKEQYRKAFSWGKKEHILERWTNRCLIVTIIIFSMSFYLRSWFLMIFTGIWLLITLLVHTFARTCHKMEKKYHQKHKKSKLFF